MRLFVTSLLHGVSVFSDRLLLSRYVAHLYDNQTGLQQEVTLSRFRVTH